MGLSAQQAQHLEYEVGALVPHLFQQLVDLGDSGTQRPILMEVACEPQSLLSQAVQSQTGDPNSAARCSLWNLSTGVGVRLVIDRIRQERPQNVWIATPCGPFSPLQHTNQRTPEQCEDLRKKRQEPMKIYVGASCVVHVCMQLGIHCIWEWAERSDAWRPPLI